MKPIPLKTWKKILMGWNLTKVRTESSHEIWKGPGMLRPIPVDKNYKDVPVHHIKTCLKALGKTTKEFEEALEKVR